jgi:hypothetical protein
MLLHNDEEFLKLQSEDGSAQCYPFAASMGVMERAYQTEWPACLIPDAPASAAAVCAYKYESSDTETDSDSTCVGRKYQVLNYDSAEEATADGAFVTHTGGTSQHGWVGLCCVGVVRYLGPSPSYIPMVSLMDGSILYPVRIVSLVL